MKTYRLLYLAAFFSAIMAAAAIYEVAAVLDIPVKTLTRDLYRAADVPWYFSYFSLLGSTIWLMTGAATLVTGMVAGKVLRCQLSDHSAYRIIILGGVIGLLMAMDDLLLFHDVFARVAGIPEISFHIFYFIFIASMIIYSRDVIRSTPWMVLFTALACFGLSSVIDLLHVASWSQSEDVFKFCAIVLWAFYFSHVAWTFVTEHSPRPVLRPAAATDTGHRNRRADDTAARISEY